MLAAEVASIRSSDPDLDARDITSFTVPLIARAAVVAALGVVPLLVVRNGAAENSQLVPIIGSTALVIICAAVVAWLTSIVISGLVVMILYRTRPAASSHLVVRILTDSFMRIDDSTSALALLALLAGLISLAFGLPTRSGDEQSNPVLDDLLAAQVGVLLAVLGVAFISEAVRSSADIVDDQSLLLAWPWALLISCLSWVLATIAGPFRSDPHADDPAERMATGHPRRSAALPTRGGIGSGERTLVGGVRSLTRIGAIWAYQAKRLGGFTQLREFAAADPPL